MKRCRLISIVALVAALGAVAVRADSTSAISVNFFHTGGALPADDWAGAPRLPGWNNVEVPGGFGVTTGAGGLGPLELRDGSDEPAAQLTSTLQSYYNGVSGTSADNGDGLMMAEYVSWDPPGDGVTPDDLGRILVSDLGPGFTEPGYSVTIFADADNNERTFTVTVNGRSVTGSDLSTFNGVFIPAAGAGTDANQFVFEDLRDASFTIDVASSTGRAALNGLQIVANDFLPPEEPPPPEPPPPGDGPNVVLFVVDDMGWQDTSVPFHDQETVWNGLYRTPNMERLASRGMVFTDAYAASPVCSPTRVSMLTGKNPARVRVTDWVGHGTSTNSFLQSAEWRAQGLQPIDRETTLPTLLRSAGYRTIHAGKAHFGNGAGSSPTRLGFDVNIGGSSVGSPRGSGSRGRYFGPFGGDHPGLEAYGNERLPHHGPEDRGRRGHPDSNRRRLPVLPSPRSLRGAHAARWTGRPAIPRRLCWPTEPRR